jgi:tRNA dimethylallyltransferase
MPSATDPVSAARRPLVVILGPTAVGKTEVALQLAARLEGEIVSADSRLLYRGMDIGTAKPTPEERARVPHHLIDVAEPDQTWSLALFQRSARQAIEDIHSRGRLPFLVGGTGQYLHAILHGWQIPPGQPDPRLRAALESWAAEIGAHGLHARLAVIDPSAAAAIDYRNLRRTIRALEVILHSGRRFSEQRRSGTAPYRMLSIGLDLPRPDLFARIDARIEKMLAAGLVQEVQNLLDRGYSPDLPALSAIGYREIADYLQGKLSLDEAMARIKRRTRQFVRRQANWFKRSDPDIHWFTVHPFVCDEIEKFILNWLGLVDNPQN